MKLFLDSSYLLSYFKVAVEGIPYDFIGQLMKKKDIKLLVSEISLSELIAKCFKLSIFASSLSYEDILSGIDSIRNDPRIQIVSWYENPKILETAYSLRKIHSDFFDCIIFATAIIEADVIGTFDDTFYKKMKKNDEISKQIFQLNPEFEFWFKDFKKSPKKVW